MRVRVNTYLYHCVIFIQCYIFNFRIFVIRFCWLHAFAYSVLPVGLFIYCAKTVDVRILWTQYVSGTSEIFCTGCVVHLVVCDFVICDLGLSNSAVVDDLELFSRSCLLVQPFATTVTRKCVFVRTHHDSINHSWLSSSRICSVYRSHGAHNVNY